MTLLERRPVPIAVGIVFVAALALYLVTLTPTVALVDSGELVTAAWSLGVAHPPGFPFYVLMAHLATRIPFGSVAVRVNAASALFAALAAALLSLAVAHALRTRPPEPRAQATSAREGRRRGSAAALTKPDASRPSPPASILPWIIAGLLFACGRTPWAYATVAEVYTLNAALLTAVFALMLQWRRRRLAPEAERGDDRPLLAAAFLFGLGLAVHISTTGLTLPALGWLVLATEGRRFFTSRRLALAALAAVAGLTAYLYLPLAAAHDPAMNWGDPRDLERLVRHVTGRQYWISFGASPEVIVDELTMAGRLLLREWGPPWLPLGLLLAMVGWVRLWGHDRALAVFVTLVAFANVAYAVSYHVAEDRDAYYLPLFLVLALAAGVGAAAVLELRVRIARPVRAGVLLLIPALGLATNWSYNDRSRFTLARDYVTDALATVAPGSLLLTSDWQLYSPLFYLQRVEGVRPDVVAVNTQLLRRSWYLGTLRAIYPEFMAPYRDTVDRYLEDLVAWERDPRGFESSPARLERINAHFYGMILAMIRGQLERNGVYVTREVALPPPQDENAPLGGEIMSSWVVVPQGLTFELRRDSAFVPPAPLRFHTAALAGTHPRFEPDDVVMTKIAPAYSAMLLMRGRYLQLHGRPEEAMAAFEQSLAIQPDFLPARDALEAARGQGVAGRP